MLRVVRTRAAVVWLLVVISILLLATAIVLGVLGSRGTSALPWHGGDRQAMGATTFDSTAAGPDMDAGQVRVAGPAEIQDYAADDLGMPVAGMTGVDLSDISTGGGRGPEGHDWTTLRPGELVIPGVSLVIPVVERGIIEDSPGVRSMELPVSFQAAWLRESAPILADRGTTVVAGHVNWSDGSWAPMSNLHNASPGMQVFLADRSGKLTSWRITGTAEYPQSELSSRVSLTDVQGPRQLVLITCKAERSSDGSVTFTHNWVVTAEPMGAPGSG